MQYREWSHEMHWKKYTTSRDTVACMQRCVGKALPALGPSNPHFAFRSFAISFPSEVSSLQASATTEQVRVCSSVAICPSRLLPAS